MPNEKIWLTDEELIKKNEVLFLEIKNWWRYARKEVLKNPNRSGDFTIFKNHLKKSSSIDGG